MKTTISKTTITNMKQIRFDNNRTSSGRNSRFLATRQMLHRVVAMLVLVVVCSGVWATDYVFTYSNGYLANNKGTIEYVTTFDPATCIWTCYNGTTEASLGTNNTNLRSLKNGNYYLNGSTTNGNAPTASSSAQNYWRLNGSYLIYRNSNSYYLYYREGWKVSTSSNTNYAYRNNTSYYSGYYGDYRATATASTTHTGSGTVTNPSLSSSLTSTGIELKHTNISGTFDPTYSQITVGGKTYYKVNGSWTETQPQANSSWSNATYTWTVTSGSGSISNGNVLTITGTTSPVVVKLTSTHTCGYSNEQTLTFNLTSVSALNDQSTPDITITPASATIDLSGSQTFSVPATISQTTITRDAYVEIKSGSQTYYKVGNTYQTTQPEEVETPGDPISFSSATWTLAENDGYLTNSGLSGQTITLTRDNTKKVGDNKTVTISVSASYGTNSKSATAIAKIPFTYIDLTALTAGDAINMGIGSTTSINGHFSYTPSDNSNGRPYTSFTYTSANTSVATVDSNGKITAVAPGTTTITVQSKKINGENGPSCTVTVNVSLVAPAISIDNDGYVTITDNNAAGSGVSIRYTVDGSTPTSSVGTAYTDKFGPVDNLTLVKAVAYKGTASSAVTSKQYITSGVIPGPGGSGGTVILNDYEDHDWTYYSDPNSPVRSLNPADVKITYFGNGNTVSTSADAIPASTTFTASTNSKVKVGVDADEDTFVYYETLERTDGSTATATSPASGRCAYTTIPNPFSVRPTYGTTNKWRGFYGWRVKSLTSGSIYSAANGGTEYAVGSIINAETEVFFAPASEYGMEVEFEALWARAYVVECGANNGLKNAISNNNLSANVTYERNFVVITGGTQTDEFTNDSQKAVTISSLYPDGTGSNTNSKYVTSNFTANKDTKFEYVYMTDAVTNTTLYQYRRTKYTGSNSAGWRSTGETDVVYFPDYRQYANNTLYDTWMEGNIQYAYLYEYQGTTTGPSSITSMVAKGNNLIIGRGVKPINTACATNLIGVKEGTDSSIHYTIRLESGVFGNFDMLTNANDATFGNTVSVKAVMGCDYDRASNNNDNLSVAPNGKLYGSSSTAYFSSSSNRNNLTYNWLVKSGKIQSQVEVGDASAESAIYMGNTGNSTDYDMVKYMGKRQLVMEGGEIASIAGGLNAYGDNRNNYVVNDGGPAVFVRIKGGTVRGSIYGAAAFAGASGDRLFVFTGGTIKGWVAGGANGTQTDGGVLYGTSRLYIGGNASVDSKGSQSVINRAVGGNVFGAGCGYGTDSSSGQVSEGTNVVIADNAYVERGVYGGGSYGFCSTDKNANIYIAGGHVCGVSGGVNGTSYSGSITGGVFGGACQNKGGSTNMTMIGGLVEGGVYGGSNSSGTLSGSVTMQINGGQVGTASKTANIHGGGYGKDTGVTKNVDITLGADGSETDADGVTVYGDVYGGSALGSVNGTKAADTYHTNVTMYAGYIHGSLYGGALGAQGTAANVYGPVAVKVYGGSVLTTDGTGANGSGAVYGCNNINGKPQRAVTVDIYGTNSHDVGSKATDPADDKYAIYAVYGGGNQASYTYTETGKVYPQVTVYNCDNSIEYVYGGGNAADVPATKVTIWGGNRIGNVFGGGHGDKNANPQKEANVTGNAEVNIYGGTIGKVFAGSNSKGTIGGTSTVNVNKDGDCAMHVDEVYGGGNEADGKAGTINIDCTGDEGEGIGAVYGGANDANIGTSANKSNIVLNITGGSIDNVFGGNNNGGIINGTITVNVDWATGADACGYNHLGNVYGAGNKADYTGDPVVNVKNGTVTGNVFGGGLSAKVTGNTDVEVTGGEVETAVYGGGALADVTGNTTVNLFDGTVNDVYGGGLGRNAVEADAEHGIEAADAVAAIVGGNTNVTLNGSVVKGSIFGCNNVNGTPKGHVKVTVTKTTAQPGAATVAYHVAAVYGGGNQAAYIPTSSTDFAEVEVVGCNNSIQYVYGGGNAASTPATKVTIEGGRLYYVFGGGNGKTEDGATIQNPGADVGYKNWTYDDTNAYGAGTTNVNIYGGTITSVFGGSNTKGNIRVASNVTLDDSGECDFEIGDVYGAGNEAEMYGNGNLTIGCIPGLDEIYGGAKNANINGDVSITITNGEFGKVFGGNNLGGDIKGSITVNIEETGCRPIVIGELYGGGNLAAYTAPTDATKYGDNAGKFPMVNVKSFTSIETVYGAGLGMTDAKIDALSTDDLKEAAKALGKTDAEITALSGDALKALTTPYFKAKGVVHGSPQVNINMIEGAWKDGWPAEGTKTYPAISNKWNNKLGTIGTVYGGGNAANVEGDTYVNIGTVSTINLVSGDDHSAKDVQGVNISGNVYGGGNAADVTGKTNVQIGQAGTTSSGE